MKIHSIEVKGLWSYRDRQRIILDGLPLIVGVGENAAGKSAILVNAIIVALYGRFPDETVHDSITTGSDQGEVSVEFVLGSAHYRVGRVYPRVAQATAVVMVADTAAKTGWRQLSSGPAAVTDFVTKLIGMDYQTSTMTWIAEQTQYGKFSGALPSKRFQLMSGIVGLDGYAPKSRVAHDNWKTADTKVSGLEGRAAELLESLDTASSDDDVSGFGALTTEEVRARATGSEDEVDRLSLALAEVNAADPKRQTVEARQALELVRGERLNRLASAEASALRSATALTAAHQRSESARAAATDRHATEVSAAAARTVTARETAARTRQQAVDALAAITAATRDLPDLVDVVTGHREAAGDAREAADNAAATAAEAQTTRAISVGEWAGLKQSVADAEARILTLRRSTTDDAHASCFSCGQHLSADDALALIESQERDIAGFEARKLEVKAEGLIAAAAITDANAARETALADAATSAAEAIRAAAAVSRAEALIATREEREDAADDADIAVTRAVNEEEKITSAAGAARDAAIAAATEAESAAVAEATAEAETAALTVAETAEPTEKEQSLERDLNAAVALIGDTATTVDERRAALTTERNGHRTAAGALTAELARRAEAQTARDEQMTRLNAVRLELAAAEKNRLIWATLAKAYGQTGVPAMILSTVIDSLNADVNESLDKLSHGELAVRMRVNAETTKGATENKISVYVETPAGVRSYKGLSGGQKFRVDVAIRVGLAKAVARGTGIPIQTFILDEGWGALDEKGIKSTIDTVFLLGEQMNVITVSHIKEVRDAFPARVVATKDGKFSTAKVETR